MKQVLNNTHIREITEYSNNLNMINQLDALKDKINTLKTNVDECYSNVLTTYTQTKSAIEIKSITSSIDKLKEYSDVLKNLSSDLDASIIEVENKKKELQGRNSYLIGIIRK